MPIFLTAFVYVPFAKVLVPYLHVYQVTAQRLKGGEVETKTFEIDPDRLKKQIIYFTGQHPNPLSPNQHADEAAVTAQVVNFLLEGIVPIIKRRVFKTVKQVSTELTHKDNQEQHKDPEEEADFLTRVRNEAELDDYDVTTDYREMVCVFGGPFSDPKLTLILGCAVRLFVAVLCYLATHW